MRKLLIGGRMKISGTNMNHQPLTTTHNTQAKVAQTLVQPRVVDASIKEEMRVLRDAQTQLSAMPDVDLDKVAEIKTALKEGRIHVDAENIAEAMIKFHQG